MNLLSSIEFISTQKDVSQYYLSSAIYVMTSRHEGFPMVLLEAQSYGLPIVSFDCLTGPKDLIISGVDGFLIPFGNIQVMTEKLLFLMINTKKRKEMGLNALCKSSNYLVDNIINKWKNILE